MASTKAHRNRLLPSLIFLLLFMVSILPLGSLSWSIERERDDYMKWVSWNLQKYHRQRSTTSMLNAESDSEGAQLRASLDPKLVKAEAAKVTYTVSQDGSGDYRSIREALDSIPKKNAKRVVLVIRPGIYREKIVIPKTMGFFTFQGDAGDPPVLSGNDTAATRGMDKRALKTFHSPTVAINADYFMAVNIIFENTAPYPEDRARGGQAVALRISGNKAAFYNCQFYGAQDTLYDHRGLHYFHNCFIQGSVDFIFGYGTSLYQNCKLNSIAKRVASVTAQKRNRASMGSGFSFVNSTVAGGSNGLVYLGRAWGPYSRVVFSYTFMDRVVIPQGWDSWRIHNPQSSGVYYGEYKCSGPGANWGGRVSWARLLTDDEAQPFLGTYYVQGDTWLLGPPTA